MHTTFLAGGIASGKSTVARNLGRLFGRPYVDTDRMAERDIRIEDEFGISDSAVKKQARSYKSVIKLDRNFHIYVHGNRNLLEQGEDEKGKFYKVYYEEEE